MVRSARLLQPCLHELLEVLHGDGAGGEHGFVVAAEVEVLPELALDLAADLHVGFAAGEVGGELRVAEFGARDLRTGFAFGLEGFLSEKSEWFKE